LISLPIYYHRFKDELSIQYERYAGRKVEPWVKGRGQGAGSRGQGAWSMEPGDLHPFLREER
jgi:hypothetical protein